MIVNEVIKRLREIDSPIFKDRIGGAADLQAARDGGNLKPPAIYVIDGAQQLAGSPDNGFRDPQQIEWRTTFIIMAIAKPPCTDTDFTGKWAADVVWPIREVIWGALCGWTPDHGVYAPIIPVSIVPGEAWDDGVSIAFTFQTTEFFSITNPRIEECLGKLRRFGIAMHGVEQVVDPCKEVDCEYPTQDACDETGDN